MGARLASLLILLGAAAPSAAGVYSWVDEQGVTHITAGNYGGNLGPHHFHLKEIVA